MPRGTRLTAPFASRQPRARTSRSPSLTALASRHSPRGTRFTAFASRHPSPHGHSAEPIRAASLGFAWSPTASINRGRRRTLSRVIRRSFARLYATWPATTRAPPRFGREEPKRVCHHTSSRRYRSGAERDTRRTSHARETGHKPSRKPGGNLLTAPSWLSTAETPVAHVVRVHRLFPLGRATPLRSG